MRTGVQISSQVVNINECDCVTVLQQWITAILTSGDWKANKMAVGEEQAWETEDNVGFNSYDFTNLLMWSNSYTWK